MQAATATRWTTVELAILLRSAGRKPLEWLSEKLERPPQEIEEVAARVRATGYPISLTVETCPVCGRRAPLMPSEGICAACHYERLNRQTAAKAARVLPLMSAKDRSIYHRTESLLEGRRADPVPQPPTVPDGASAVERMRAADAYEAALAERAGRIEKRKQRAAQKRLERMRAKATA